jgi:hypothetical protein
MTRGFPIAPRPKSVVLTDWAVEVDHLRANRDNFVYQLLLLSLLYDEVLIQDEALVLSDTLAHWFGESDGREIWEELLDIGSLVVLKHPLFAYPTDELRENAQNHPIEARAKYIERFGTKGDQQFKVSDIQARLYSNIEWCLKHKRTPAREVGANRGIDIMPLFSRALWTVLSEGGYAAWIESNFPTLRAQDVSRFLKLISDPEGLVKSLEKKGVLRNIVRDQNGQPVLNRSLAYQAASLFPLTQKTKFQQIIQSAFAMPFCWRERAIGRYGGVLKAIPPRSTQPVPDRKRTRRHSAKQAIAIVEAHVNVPIAMPSLRRGFGKAIVDVRESVVGKELRDAVSRMGQSITFDEQKYRWQAVAEELATKVMGPIAFGVSIDAVKHKLIDGVVTGAIVHNFAEYFAAKYDFLTSLASLAGPAMGAGHAAAGIAYDSLSNLWKTTRSVQDLCSKLENAIDFRCTWIQEPPNLTSGEVGTIYFPSVGDEEGYP